jgi:hypothetical protein
MHLTWAEWHAFMLTACDPCAGMVGHSPGVHAKRESGLLMLPLAEDFIHGALGTVFQRG